MKFEFPKTVRQLPLQEYDPANASLAGVAIHVWVDPPRAVLLEFHRLNRSYAERLDALARQAQAGKLPQKKAPGRVAGWVRAVLGRREGNPVPEEFRSFTESYRRAIHAWYAALWSQSPDESTHWTADELEQMDAANPALYDWLCRQSWLLIDGHGTDTKKGSRPPLEKSPAPEKPAT
jgi:hypothetical protein